MLHQNDVMEPITLEGQKVNNSFICCDPPGLEDESVIFSSSEPMSDSSEELAEDSDEEIDSTVARWQGANVDAIHKEREKRIIAISEENLSTYH